MKFKTFVKLLVLVVVVVGAYMVYNSQFFEKHTPKLEVYMEANKQKHLMAEDNGYWNPARVISIRATDDTGIRSYKILATTADGKVVYSKEEVVLDKPQEKEFVLPKPNIPLLDGTKIHYKISVTDWSNAHFFSGNTATRNLDLTIDTQAPLVDIIANSYKITYGGSALLVFKVIDNSVQSIQVSNGEDDFKAFPFMESGYYAVILAWPVQNNFFNGTITVADKAFNQKRVSIPFIKDMSVRYRYSDIKVKDSFLNGKLNELIDNVGERDPESFKDNIDKFKYINETIRQRDEATIYKATTDVDYTSLQKPIVFAPFLPLKGSMVVGSFGDHRSYFLGKKKISKSLHLGMDLASVKNAPIIVTNSGKVVLTELLGVYGNTTIIYHGFGLSSLYSHMSKINVTPTEIVAPDTVIGFTGQTGWAFGDHLHLGILVQGHAVRDVEWMDPKWIKVNITDVFQKAQNTIKAAE
ncbi:hypothetical protein BKH46_03620 [Helicobacter sp. 12S02634-8]|uniref:M23 family metallopeptidase n=1 Tax=Helicobacter sp. 12S02634-8 TaxID=1476199 RepID=UPI000BA7D5B6|nr:M23 family metallopeptidase [Helicobacter sp. 12S02634-8]PAF47527.1 hypothetical protein BKH46_03620 [Helicobacter sp. 12S02634-8]